MKVDAAQTVLPAAIAAEPTPAGPESVFDPLQSFDRLLRFEGGRAADEEGSSAPEIGTQEVDESGAWLRLFDVQGGPATVVNIAPPPPTPGQQKPDPVASDRSAAQSLSNAGLGAVLPAPTEAADRSGVEIVSMHQAVHHRPSLPSPHFGVSTRSMPEPVHVEAATAEPQPDQTFTPPIGEITPAPGPRAAMDGASPRSSDVGTQVGAALQGLLSSRDFPDGAGSARPARSEPAFDVAPQAVPASVSPKLRVLNLVLRPQELGRVAIELKLSGALLTVTLRTETEATRQLLEPEVDRLKDQLATAGYGLDGIALEPLPASGAATEGLQRADDPPARSDSQAGASDRHGHDGSATSGERHRRSQRSEVAPRHGQPDDPPDPPRRTGLYV